MRLREAASEPLRARDLRHQLASTRHVSASHMLVRERPEASLARGCIAEIPRSRDHIGQLLAPLAARLPCHGHRPTSERRTESDSIKPEQRRASDEKHHSRMSKGERLIRRERDGRYVADRPQFQL